MHHFCTLFEQGSSVIRATVHVTHAVTQLHFNQLLTKVDLFDNHGAGAGTEAMSSVDITSNAKPLESLIHCVFGHWLDGGVNGRKDELAPSMLR